MVFLQLPFLFEYFRLQVVVVDTSGRFMEFEIDSQTVRRFTGPCHPSGEGVGLVKAIAKGEVMSTNANVCMFSGNWLSGLQSTLPITGVNPVGINGCDRRKVFTTRKLGNGQTAGMIKYSALVIAGDRPTSRNYHQPLAHPIDLFEVVGHKQGTAAVVSKDLA